MSNHTYWLLFFVLFAFSFSNPHSSGKDYPQDYFGSPVGHTPLISGTFGELRPNHFHSGIDIKSKHGKIGDPLYATATGTVSRLKVQASGYGKAIYLDHPNGYTTVYAHLHKFPDEIEKYIKEKQYENESFFVDLYPPAGTFDFDKGDVVGIMGNTGRSSGPHIHYEIRNTATEEPINPLLFGFRVKDNIAPKIHQIKVYSLNDKHEEQQGIIKNTVKGKSGIYYVGGDTLKMDAWRIGIGVKTYDHMNGTSNWNGVYAIETYVDDALFHKTEFEKFHFDNTRYINSHTDYREKLLNKAWFNRCYRMPGNDIPMYPTMENDGVFPISSKARKITIKVFDANGNVSELVFWVKRKATEQAAENDDFFNYSLPHHQENFISRNDLMLNFPEGTFYENLYLKYSSSPDSSSNTFSNAHHIHHKKLPLHKWYKIGIRAKNIPDNKKDKAFIALCDGNKKPISHGGRWEGDLLVAKSRDLGDYCIMIDETPPKITPLIFKKNMKGYSKMQFKVSDNFKTSRNLDAYTWKGYIDDKWVLFVPNSTETVITHRFEKDLPSGEHIFRLELRDERGNISIFERTFLR